MYCKKQKGFSLLEVLIAWVILSVVLLGLLEYQLQGIRLMQESNKQTEKAVVMQSQYEQLVFTHFFMKMRI